jgi:hypothetical protein
MPRFEVFVAVKVYILVSRIVVVVQYIIIDVSGETRAFIMR